MLITCIDSRIVASRVVQTSPGETLVSRNPGSFLFSSLYPLQFSGSLSSSLLVPTFSPSVKFKGSLIPNYNLLSKDTPRPEEAALELACKINHVDTIVLCGHADCKVNIAMISTPFRRLSI